MKSIIQDLTAVVVLLAVVACSAADWRRTEDVAVDVAECTVERLIDEARRKGQHELVQRLQIVAREVPVDAGAER